MPESRAEQLRTLVEIGQQDPTAISTRLNATKVYALVYLSFLSEGGRLGRLAAIVLISNIGDARGLLCAAGERCMPIEVISRLVGHRSTTVTETVYRKQLRPVIEGGAGLMDRISPRETGPRT
jgi:hypothetical protein